MNQPRQWIYTIKWSLSSVSTQSIRFVHCNNLINSVDCCARPVACIIQLTPNLFDPRKWAETNIKQMHIAEQSHRNSLHGTVYFFPFTGHTRNWICVTQCEAECSIGSVNELPSHLSTMIAMVHSNWKAILCIYATRIASFTHTHTLTERENCVWNIAFRFGRIRRCCVHSVQANRAGHKVKKKVTNDKDQSTHKPNWLVTSASDREHGDDNGDNNNTKNANNKQQIYRVPVMAWQFTK